MIWNDLVTLYPWLSLEMLGNSLAEWILALLFSIVGWGVFNLFQYLAVQRLKALNGDFIGRFSSFLATVIAKVNPVVEVVIAVCLGLYFIEMSPDVRSLYRVVFYMAIVIQLALWGQPIVDFLLKFYIDTRKTDDEKKIAETLMGVTSISILTVYWGVLMMFVLDKFGVNITALVTGLGIGGVAVALAVQNTLKDLLAALAIITDRPFTVGDFIVVGTEMGTVSHIGLKTTRVQSLSGEELVFSNDDLLSSRIRNYLRMEERRVVFGLGVTYQTPLDKLQAIPDMVKTIIESQEFTRFDRGHFFKYGASSLDFEFVYYVKGNDYTRYMDMQQAINLAIYKQFDAQGIEFAYPTQTLFHQPVDKSFSVSVSS